MIRLFAYTWLLFLLTAETAHCATYFVSKTGLDAHACSTTDSAGTNKLTITAGIACLSGGDTLDIHAGTYAEYLEVPASKSGPGAGMPTTIRGHAGESVTLKPTTTNTSGGNNIVWAYGSYITFDHLLINGASLPNGPTNLVGFGESSTASHHLVLQDSSVVNLVGTIAPGSGSGCISSFGSDNTDFTYRRVIVDNCMPVLGTTQPGEHCVYLPGQRHTLEYSHLSRCYNMGVQIFSGGAVMPDENTVRYNLIDHTGGTGILVSERNARVYGNIIQTFSTNTSAYPGQAGITVAAYTGTVRVLQNTISDGPLGIKVSSTGATVRNNVLATVAVPVQNDGTNTVDYNVTDPTLVDAGGGDFNLATGSAAIDAGTDLSASAPAGMNTNFVGTAPDCGALEAPLLSGAVVANATPSTLTLTFTNAFAPLVAGPCPTVSLNGGANVATSCVVAGAALSVSLSTPVVFGQTVTYSAAAGAVTGSQLLGNLTGPGGNGSLRAVSGTAVNQVLAVTPPPVTGGGGGEDWYFE